MRRVISEQSSGQKIQPQYGLYSVPQARTKVVKTLPTSRKRKATGKPSSNSGSSDNSTPRSVTRLSKIPVLPKEYTPEYVLQKFAMYLQGENILKVNLKYSNKDIYERIIRYDKDNPEPDHIKDVSTIAQRLRVAILKRAQHKGTGYEKEDQLHQAERQKLTGKKGRPRKKAFKQVKIRRTHIPHSVQPLHTPASPANLAVPQVDFDVAGVILPSSSDDTVITPWRGASCQPSLSSGTTSFSLPLSETSLPFSSSKVSPDLPQHSKVANLFTAALFAELSYTPDVLQPSDSQPLLLPIGDLAAFPRCTYSGSTSAMIAAPSTYNNGGNFLSHTQQATPSSFSNSPDLNFNISFRAVSSGGLYDPHTSESPITTSSTRHDSLAGSRGCGSDGIFTSPMFNASFAQPAACAPGSLIKDQHPPSQEPLSSNEFSCVNAGQISPAAFFFPDNWDMSGLPAPYNSGPATDEAEIGNGELSHQATLPLSSSGSPPSGSEPGVVCELATLDFRDHLDSIQHGGLARDQAYEEIEHWIFGR